MGQTKGIKRRSTRGSSPLLLVCERRPFPRADAHSLDGDGDGEDDDDDEEDGDERTMMAGGSGAKRGHTVSPPVEEQWRCSDIFLRCSSRTDSLGCTG